MKILTVPFFSGVQQGAGAVNNRLGAASVAFNVDTDYGRLASAGGYERYSEAAVPGEARRCYLFEPHTSAGILRHIIVAAGGSVYALRHGASEFIRLFEGAKNDGWDFLTYLSGDQGVLLMGNGEDSVMVWDGVSDTLSNLTGAPAKARFFCLHYDRVWMGGDPACPDRLFYSRRFDAHDWSGDILTPRDGGGLVDVPTFDGGTVTGIMRAGEDILIVKNTTMLRIYGTGPESYRLIQVNGAAGVCAARSHVQHGSNHYFLSERGIVVYSGGTAAPMSDRAFACVFDKGLEGVAGVEPGELYLAPAMPLSVASTASGGTLLFSIPVGQSARNNLILEYDTARGAAMMRRGVEAAGFMRIGGEKHEILFAGYDGQCSRIYRLGGGRTLDGRPQASLWSSGWVDFSDKQLLKTITGIHMFGAVGAADGRPENAGLEVTIETERGHRSVVFRPYYDGRRQAFRARTLLQGMRFRLVIRNLSGAWFNLEGGIELTMSGADDEWG